MNGGVYPSGGSPLKKVVVVVAMTSGDFPQSRLSLSFRLSKKVVVVAMTSGTFHSLAVVAISFVNKDPIAKLEKDIVREKESFEVPVQRNDFAQQDAHHRRKK